MDALSFLPAGLVTSTGIWIGFLFTLMIFSAILGDNALARLGQYILVGAALGYAAVLAWQEVLRPQLLAPLATTFTAAPANGVQAMIWLWILLALAILLTVAGLERIFRAPTRPDSAQGWRGVLHVFGAIPLALMLGVAVATGLIGAVQGTLWPQFLRAAQTGLPLRSSPATLGMGILTLLITSGVLIYLRADQPMIDRQPAILRQLLNGWVAIGKRALWLAAGLLFARLLVARLTLLIARADYFMLYLEQTGIWRWVEALLGKT